MTIGIRKPTALFSRTSHKLDNAAQLYPAIARAADAHVFRITAQLKEPIQPDRLQSALELVLPRFRAYNVKLRKTFFRHYFELHDSFPLVQEDLGQPCGYFANGKNDGFLFRVLYSGAEIHLETFHALTDGTGATHFLKALCYRYLQLIHPEDFSADQVESWFGLEQSTNVADGYAVNYQPGKMKVYRQSASYQLRGRLRPGGTIGVDSLRLPIGALKTAAKAAGATLGEYLCAMLLYLIQEEFARGRARRPICIDLPVNLRPLCQTDTSLNFFSVAEIALENRGGPKTFPQILEDVQQQFKEKITRERLLQKFLFTVWSEQTFLAQVIPAAAQNWVLKGVYSFLGNRTLCFSNLGLQTVAEPFADYFVGFRMLTSPSKREPIKVSACGYGDTLSLTFTSILADDRLQQGARRFFQEQGIPVSVE